VSSAKNMLIVGKYTIQGCCGIGKGGYVHCNVKIGYGGKSLSFWGRRGKWAVSFRVIVILITAYHHNPHLNK